MAKGESSKSDIGWLRNLLHTGLYKPTQGRVIRQVTGVSLAILFLLIAYATATVSYLVDWLGNGHYLVVVVLEALAVWLAYRLVNYPPLSDFLIAVEAEMNKVSWPGRTELVRASIVVMFVIFAMAGVLYGFDIVWAKFFQIIGIRH